MLLTDMMVFFFWYQCGIKDTDALDLEYIYVPNYVDRPFFKVKNVIRSVSAIITCSYLKKSGKINDY